MSSWLRAGALATIWVLLWGSASVANVVTGLAIGWLLVLVVPGLRGAPGGSSSARSLPPDSPGTCSSRSSRPTCCSSARCSRRLDRIRTAVIGVPLPGCSDNLLTLVGNLIALSPGTVPIELTHEPAVLYAHVLHLRDLDTTRRDILRLTDLAVRAFGSAEAVAAQDEFVRRSGAS